MKAKDFATAIYNALKEGKRIEDVLARIDTVLEKHGAQKIKRAVLLELMSLLKQDKRYRDADVIIAKEADRQKYAAAITKSLEELDATKDHEVEIDERIAGGYIVRVGGRQIDASFKRKLLQLYKNITQGV